MKKQTHKGIWKYREKMPRIDEKYQVTLGEGGTSLRKIEDILFKCEFENPTGSVKDRGIAYQVSKLTQNHREEAVLPSSGNAAISASHYCRKAHIALTVFVGYTIHKKKLEVLKALQTELVQTAKPVSAAFGKAQSTGAYNLRQSADPYGAIGYETIAYEILEEEVVDAVFTPVSSGTHFVGMAQGFFKEHVLPAMHLVQTETVHPVSSHFDTHFRHKEKSIADAIVAKSVPRQKEIEDIVEKTNGWGWTLSDEEIRQAHKWLLTHGIECSYEGGATLAGLWKAKQNGYIYKNPVCILTGKFY